MKRILSISPMITCLFYSFLPICKIIGAAYGYSFTLYNYSAAIIVLTVISIIIPVLLLSFKISLTKTLSAFSALLLPLSALNGLFFVLVSDQIITVLFMLVFCFTSSVMLYRFTYSKALKVASTIVSTMLILFLLFAALVHFTFGNFSINTVVKSLASPQNTYTVEVIDNNQGALGGATHVEVRNTSKDIRLYIGEFSKSPVRVYTGKWGESENMQIAWKDEHTLLIDGKEYSISE